MNAARAIAATKHPPGAIPRPAPTLSPSRSAGVTMIELLVVISIMAFLATVAVPMLSGAVSGSELKSAAREVAAGLRYARNEAVATRQETRVVLDLEGRTFRIDRDARVHALPKKIDLKLFTAQSDIADDKTGAIRFYPDGGASGGRVTIAAGERKYEVDVDWLTGRVAILD